MNYISFTATTNFGKYLLHDTKSEDYSLPERESFN